MLNETITKTFTVLLALAISTTCATAADAPKHDGVEKIAQDVVAGDAPAMWEVTDEDTTLYVLGTFHILPPEIKWRTPVFEMAMAQADRTITEAETDSIETLKEIQSLIGEIGMNTDGVTLSSILGDERYQRFSTACAKIGVPTETLEPFKPWLAMLTVSVIALQAKGYDPAAGVDKAVTTQAINEGDIISHFETAEQQIRILASLDENEMLANFDVSLEQIENFDALSDAMLTAWATGNTEQLREIFVTPIKSESPDAFKKLLVSRNEDWARQIDTIMSNDGKYFIAVGTAHLVGEKNLFELIDDENISIRRIQ